MRRGRWCGWRTSGIAAGPEAVVGGGGGGGGVATRPVEKKKDVYRALSIHLVDRINDNR